MRREQLIAPVICLMVISAVMGAAIIEAFGPSSPYNPDQNGDGIVTAADLGIVASHFGTSAPGRPCWRYITVLPGEPWPDAAAPVDLNGTPVTPSGGYLVAPADWQPGDLPWACP